MNTESKNNPDQSNPDEVSNKTMERVKVFARCGKILQTLEPADAAIVVRALAILHEP